MAFGSLQGMPLVLGLSRRGVPTQGEKNIQGIQQEVGGQNTTIKAHNHGMGKLFLRPTC